MSTIAEEGLKRALEAERQAARPSNVRSAWEALFEEARRCTRCDLYKYATQTVFGEGPLNASIMFVGEQPGDQEDLAGRPFVGPAGALFDAALEKAGIDRSTVYVTNAVKHFKFVAKGKRRIHNKPDAGEISACRWWIEHERELIRPPVTVALGATAARSLIGRTVTIGKIRGEPLALEDGSECWVTVHPSSLLRMPDPEKRREGRALFLRDLKLIKARAAQLVR
jgi:uracil-DNA glycosylase family protein